MAEIEEYKIKISNLSFDDQVKRELYLKKLALGKIQGPTLEYATTDMPWLQFYGDDAIKAKPFTEGPYDFFKKKVKEFNNKTALTYIPKDNIKINISFNKYEQEAKRIAEALVTSLRPGEVVLSILPDTPESKYLLIACLNLGVPLYPLSPLVSPSVLDKILEKNDISKLFLFGFFADKFSDVIKNHEEQLEYIVHFNGAESLPPIMKAISSHSKDPMKEAMNKKINSNKSISYDEFIKKASLCTINVDDYYKYDPEKIALIIGTSGSTGTPKDVGITGKNIMTIILEHENDFIDFKPGDKYLEIMGNSIAYGAISSLLTLYRGVHTYFRPGYTMDPYKDIKHFHITQLVGGPVHSRNVALHKRAGQDMKKLKLVVCGGGALNPVDEATNNSIDIEKLEYSEDSGNIINRQGYGSTEKLGVITFQKQDSYKFGSVGIPLSKDIVGIFDPKTNEELHFGEVGEICVCSDAVMKGYINNQTETDIVLKKHSDGRVWLHTKDLGYMDKQGHVFFTDRIKNCFQRTGMNVHPASIEKFIKSIEIVSEAVVVGVDHPEQEKVPVAFIKFKDGIDENEALKVVNTLCFKNLEETSIPYEFIVVDDIPINAGGKPDVPSLLQTYNIDYSNQVGLNKEMMKKQASLFNIN